VLFVVLMTSYEFFKLLLQTMFSRGVWTKERHTDPNQYTHAIRLDTGSNICIVVYSSEFQWIG
jgi:hypothetical protein